MKRIFAVVAVLGILAVSCAASPPKQNVYTPAPVQAVAAAPAALVSQPQAQALEVLPIVSSVPDISSTITSPDAQAPADTQGIVAAEAPRLSLEIISVTSPVKQGESVTLKAQTMAGARCSISVYYKSVRSGLADLNEKTAEASGAVSWTWRTGNDLAPGSYRIEITSRLGEKSESKTVYFTVS